MPTHFDVLLIGGGLQNGLLALALLARDPDLRLAVVERGPVLGGNHMWCFHDEDIPEALRPVIAPLAAHRWAGYQVKFAGYERRLASGYNGIPSSRFHAVVSARLLAAPNCALLLGTAVASVAEDRAVLADGRVLTGDVIVDARGPRAESSPEVIGYQKFVGHELRLHAPHGLEHPIIMDARVEQLGGYRFVYTLPLAPDRLLVEDTYFADSPELAVVALRARIAEYARSQGWDVAAVEREERGVLPLTGAGRVTVPDAGAIPGGYGGGWFHPVTGYSLPVAARFAEVVAGASPDQLRASVRRLARAHGRQLRFAHRLNRMLFHWFPPHERRNVLERFYRLPESTIRRFYALQLTAADRARILCGRPPRGMSYRAALAGRKVVAT